MRMILYPNLAIQGIVKNKKIYLPYILSCIGMVMMSFIIQSVGDTELLKHIKGGATVSSSLNLCKFVLAVFALIFLTYTNSFLVKRRYKEFGLYNVIGMNKKGILRIVAFESIFVAIISIITGMALGIVFSKFAELGLFNAIREEFDYSFRISTGAVKYTLEIYIVIFFLLFVKSLIQVAGTKPLELLKSENFGEKPPKANALYAVAGAVILGVAYYLAVSIESPLKALTLFFVAVIMVIVATYMLFTAGSVFLCRLLQKNKNYYYKKNHFISVSSMVFRMKRNGAGLASICILSTMVLVMFSSTASLYIGAEDSIKNAYPRDIEVAVKVKCIDDMSDENIDSLVAGYNEVINSYQLKPYNVMSYKSAFIMGQITENSMDTDVDTLNFNIQSYDSLRQLYFMSDEDYNAVMGTDITVNQGEMYIGTVRCKFNKPELKINGIIFNNKGTIKDIPCIGDANISVIPSMIIIISDLSEIIPLEELADFNGDKVVSAEYYYGFDLDADKEVQNNVRYSLVNKIGDSFAANDNGYSYSSACKDVERDDFYSTFGGLFFIGIMLCIVFVAATLLIIYYKQISEGYEDKQRFEIMQKVGMNKSDIKKSISSQVLTVFFIPLIFAGIHTAFALPMVEKCLQLFNMNNLKLIITVNIAAFIIFAIFYVIIYLTTARSYYNIVGEK